MCTASHVIVADNTSAKRVDLFEVRIKELKYNLTRVLLQKSKLAQHAYEEGHRTCSKEVKV
jgi:hypothetical protein